MSTIPSPLFALVGATDAITSRARALPEKLAAFEIRRFEGASIDLTALDPRKVQLRRPELTKIDLSRVDVRKVDVRNVDVANVADSAREYASKGQQHYHAFVARGEEVVARVRGQEQTIGADASLPDVTAPVPTPLAVASKETAAKKAATKRSGSKTDPGSDSAKSTDV